MHLFDLLQASKVILEVVMIIILVMKTMMTTQLRFLNRGDPSFWLLSHLHCLRKFGTPRSMKGVAELDLPQMLSMLILFGT